MDRTKALKGVAQFMDPPMKAEGFRLVLSRDAYQRKFPDGEQRFYLRAYSVGVEIRIEPSAAIRLSIVEAIFHRTSGLPISDQRESATLWTPAAALARTESESVVQRIATESDLEPAAHALCQIYDSLVRGYFEQNSNLAAAEAILNEDPLQLCPHSSMPRRASYGVILAALQKRDDLDALIEQHRAGVAMIDRGFHLPAFEAVVKDLKADPPAA